MKFRIDATVFLDEGDEVEARRLFREMKGAKARFRVINESTDKEESSQVRLHRCYHDEPELNLPCEEIETVESTRIIAIT